MFGLPASTVIVFVSVPVFFTVVLFLWGAWYRPEKDESGDISSVLNMNHDNDGGKQ